MKLSLLAVALGLATLPLAAAPVSYPDVPTFLKTYRNVETSVDQGVWGDLDGIGGLDWAGVVYFNGEDDRQLQVVLLTRGLDGRFILSGSTEARSSHGGTGNFGIEEVTIDKRSVFLSSSWHWHGCAGQATHQFRQQNGQWVLVGAEIGRSTSRIDKEGNYDTGDDLHVSVNWLALRADSLYTPNGRKPQKRQYKLKPAQLLLDQYNWGMGPPEEVPPYASC